MSCGALVAALAHGKARKALAAPWILPIDEHFHKYSSSSPKKAQLALGRPAIAALAGACYVGLLLSLNNCM
jgi:hypothetical protein